MSMPRNVAELVRVGSLELIAKNRSIVCKMYWSEQKMMRGAWGTRVPIGQEVLGGHAAEGSDIALALRAADRILGAWPPEYDNFPRLKDWLLEHPEYKIRTILNKYRDSSSWEALQYPITTAIGPGARMTASAKGSELNTMLKELEKKRYLG